MPKLLVILIFSFFLKVLDLNLVGILERFELSLINSLLPLQILLDLSQLLLKNNDLCLSKRISFN